MTKVHTETNGQQITELVTRKPIWIRETFINQTKGHIFGEGPAYEMDFYQDETGKLFRSLQREYGACQSKVYIDKTSGAVPVGWVFAKRMEYEDSRPGDKERFYIREVWVHCYANEPKHQLVATDLQIGRTA